MGMTDSHVTPSTLESCNDTLQGLVDATHSFQLLP